MLRNLNNKIIVNYKIKACQQMGFKFNSTIMFLILKPHIDYTQCVYLKPAKSENIMLFTHTGVFIEPALATSSQGTSQFSFLIFPHSLILNRKSFWCGILRGAISGEPWARIRGSLLLTDAPLLDISYCLDAAPDRTALFLSQVQYTPSV